MLSFDVRMLCLSALRILSEILFVINASGVFWMMLRWPLMNLLCCFIAGAEGVSVNAQGNNG